jgi:hypothetical protein
MFCNVKRSRLAAAGFTVLASSVALALGAASAVPAAETLTRISSDPYTAPPGNHKTQVEPDTFAFGNTVVSTFQSGRIFDGGASNIGWATSVNGGRTWTHGFLPGSTVLATPPGIYPRASDPSVAYDARHKVWLISWLGLFPHGNTSEVDVLVSRSTNGGRSFGRPVAVDTSGAFNDKNWTVCDNTATSPFFGHCYTEFDKFSSNNRISMSTSTDGGKSWGAPKTTPDRTCVIGGQPVVQPDGTVIVPIDDCLESVLLSVRSTDGGATWKRPVLAAQLLTDLHPGAIRAPTLPSAEIDRSGRVYVVWSDCRFEAACNAGNNDLLLTTSTDGVHWTLPRRIPTARVGTRKDFLIPGLAVDRSTAGRSAHLALTYYYFSNVNCTPKTCRLNVGFVSSVNGGASWSAPEQLAGPMNLRWSPLTTQGFMVGDYISTSIVPGDDDATPVFMVAHPPGSPPSCSNLKTGAPGLDCHQATYTTPEDLLTITGGPNPATAPASPRVTKHTARSAPATAY